MKDIGEYIIRVTGGDGGEAFLILGSQKTAVVDTGMAYCAGKMIENLKKALNGRPLDYILATHSHYDHIGALANLKEVWPDSISMGAAYAKKILDKPNALKLIRDLSHNAKKIFDPENKFPPFDYDDNLMVIDQVIKTDDRIDLGDTSILVLETPGHTQCSLTFFLEPQKVMFTSETLGVLMNSGKLVPGFVISYENSIKMIDVCRALNPEHIIVPHTGILNKKLKDRFFDDAKREMITYKEFICDKYNSGLEYEEVLEALADSVKEDLDANGQPKKAFMLNAAAMVKNVINDFCQVRGN